MWGPGTVGLEPGRGERPWGPKEQHAEHSMSRVVVETLEDPEKALGLH